MYETPPPTGHRAARGRSRWPGSGPSWPPWMSWWSRRPCRPCSTGWGPGWGSREVAGALAAGAALMAAFLAWERRARYPMLPLAYFGRRGFATANTVVFFQFISVIGSLFFITQLFQLGMGYSPLQAGLRILVWMAMPMAVAPIAGALADRIGSRPFMAAGLAMQAIGLGWLAAAVTPAPGPGESRLRHGVDHELPRHGWR